MSNQTATAVNAIKYSAEQAARALLDRMGVPNVQAYSSGDLVELANLIAASGRIVVGDSPDLRELGHHFNESATTGRPLTLPASSCALLLAAMTTGSTTNATGETGRKMALRFKREANALWPRLNTAEQNSARYTAWRDAMVAQDQKFIDAMALALPAAVGHSREPTTAEWDAAIDKAAGLPTTGAPA